MTLSITLPSATPLSITLPSAAPFSITAPSAAPLSITLLPQLPVYNLPSAAPPAKPLLLDCQGFAAVRISLK